MYRDKATTHLRSQSQVIRFTRCIDSLARAGAGPGAARDVRRTCEPRVRVGCQSLQLRKFVPVSHSTSDLLYLFVASAQVKGVAEAHMPVARVPEDGARLERR